MFCIALIRMRKWYFSFDILFIHATLKTNMPCSNNGSKYKSGLLFQYKVVKDHRFAQFYTQCIGRGNPEEEIRDPSSRLIQYILKLSLYIL